MIVEGWTVPLPSGKLPPEVLESRVLRYGGTPRPEVLIGPGVGEDAAVISWPEGKFLVVSSDPIVGASRGAGRLLVHVNANDVASKGADPAYLLVTLILPRSWKAGDAETLMADIDAVSRELGVAVVGGHTEFSDRYKDPVLCGTLLGTADRVLAAHDIRSGDVLLVTKHVGIEGMTILEADRPEILRPVLGEPGLREVARWSELVSVVPEARILRRWARFMHDPTEGGFLGGLDEICRLAGLGAHLLPDAVPIHPLTRATAEVLSFDPLRLISSGVLVAVLPPETVADARRALAGAGIPATVVGTVAVDGVRDFGLKEELWRLLAWEASGKGV